MVNWVVVVYFHFTIFCSGAFLFFIESQELFEQTLKGRHIYIPQTERQTWGSSTGIKAELLKRNQEIVSKYTQGLDVKTLSGMYNLSEERIRGIIAANKIKRK